MNSDVTIARTSEWRQLRLGFRRQRAVVLALVFKEFKQRLGRSRLGLMWLLVEPIVHMSMMSAVWYASGRQTLQGFHVTLFLSSGIACYFLIKRGFGVVPMAITANQALLNYPQVKPLDTVFARFVLDVLTTTMAAVLMFSGLWWFAGIELPFPSVLEFTGVFVLTLGFSLGLGISLCYFVTVYPSINKAMMFIDRPLYFASGVLFPVHNLPADVRWYLYWNPIVHLVDMWRFTLLGLPMAPEANPVYPGIWAISMLGMGSLIYYANRYKLIEK